jgi:PAS domain S-box-containing protein
MASYSPGRTFFTYQSLRQANELLGEKLEGHSGADIASFGIYVDRFSRDRIALEEALQESEERFRALSEMSDLIALILNSRGNIVFCNQYLLNLIGLQKEEIIGRNWCDVCVPWDQYPRERFISQLANASVPVRHKNEIIARGGRRRLIAWYNTILFDEAFNPKGTASVAHEIRADISSSCFSHTEREALSRFYLLGQTQEQIHSDLGVDPECLLRLTDQARETFLRRNLDDSETSSD